MGTSFANVIEFSYSFGTLNGIGFSLVPELRFWNIEVWFRVDFILNYQDYLKIEVPQTYHDIPYYFDMNLRKGGVEFSSAHFSFPFSITLNDTEKGWNFWTETFGMFVKRDRKYLYLKNPLIVVVGDDGSGEIGVPIRIKNFGLIPFYTGKNFGVWFIYENSGVSFTREHIAVRISSDKLIFKAIYNYENKDIKIGLGFYYKGNWLILSEKSIEFQYKMEGYNVLGKFSKEGWRIQFSIPVW